MEKGTKLLNKAIQIVLDTNNEFVVLEEVYKRIALNYPELNSEQIKNLNRKEEKSATNFKKIFGFEYDAYYSTNKIIIEEIARVIRYRINQY